MTYPFLEWYQRLRDRGYNPIPLNGKRPFTEGWENPAIQWDPWLQTYAAHNVGILTGKVIALDIDIDDAAINAAIHDEVAIRWDPDVPCRVGRQPRKMLIFRSAHDHFPKITRQLTLNGVPCRIEVLGTGQQFAAFGTHPDTKQPFTWPVPLCDFAVLPAVTREEMQEFLTNTIAALASEGLAYDARTASSGTIERRAAPEPIEDLPDDTPAQVAEALANVSPNGWDQTVAVGMALKAAHNDGEPWAEEAFRAFARTSDRYPLNPRGEAWISRRWDSFHPSKSTMDTLYRSAGTAQSNHQADFEEVADCDHPESMPDKALAWAGYLTGADWAQRDPPRWLIKDTLPEGGLFSIIAKPNVGKSFLLLDMAEAVTSARPWFGKRTKPPEKPLCALFAYEGSPITRYRALAKRYGENAGARTLVMAGGPKVGDADDMRRAIEHLRDAQRHFGARLCLIAFDTLNLALKGGDENSSEDMGAAINGLKMMQRAFQGAAVGVVHHIGKDASKGGRGHSSLFGGIDTEIRIDEDQGGLRRITLSKSRDSDRSGTFGAFVLQPVNIGVDEDGDPQTSCVIDSRDVLMAERDQDGEKRLRVLAAVRQAEAEGVQASGRYIRDAIGGDTHSTPELLAAMVADGILKEVPFKGKGAKPGSVAYEASEVV